MISYIFGRSELASKKKTRPAILADSVEAIIAAIYLDGGLEKAASFMISNLSNEILLSSKSVGMKDYKTVLQEKLQAIGEVHIEYELINESGPDHDKMFTVRVKCNGLELARGIGKSKKTAEAEAARIALEEI